jgi:hypothetical protein
MADKSFRTLNARAPCLTQMRKGRSGLEFVPKKDIDELYLRDPYIVPDGEVGQQAVAVIRDAIGKEGTTRAIPQAAGSAR